MYKPQMYGGHVPVSLYFEPETFEEIEKKRGKTSRNAFITGIVKESLKTVVC